ncbi:hypothetical protein B0H17DRAFT_1070333 [Mycena rosella]|uniref:F-box domain-containing protein n=1 Tax=Mycena rosella TaxID=1033263 RepID=A0AAD7DAV3_MYCRO|nr:hypothetical protein B0H17DRAFT_1070333 [Mycena rosella]
MVLTRRAHRDISRRLPNEIITEIAQAAPRSDQLPLCRVSKLFHALTLPALYRDVRIETEASDLAFRSAVMSNNALAELVRSYTLISFLSRATPLLVDSLTALTRLEDLRILAFSMTYAHSEELLDCTFPHLTKCRLFLSTQKLNLLVSFLLRHPRLKILGIQDIDDMGFWPPTARVPLLNLTQLWCPVRLVPSIITHNLQRARLVWNDREVEPSAVEKTSVALKSMASSDTLFVCSNDSCDPNFPEIVDSISRNMPYTTTLLLGLWDFPSSNEITGQLAHCLPRFRCLEFLCLHVDDVGDTFWNNEEDQTVVHSMGDAFPTLQALRLHQRTWRKVDQT